MLREIEEKFPLVYEITDTHAILIGTSIPSLIASDVDFLAGKGYVVTEIADGAFANCKELIEVRFHRFVDWIGEDVFKNCHKLDSVTFEGKDTYIDPSNLKALKDIKIRCVKDSNVSDLAYEGFNVEIFE